MATVAPAGRIDEAAVDEEIARLMALWTRVGADPDRDLLAEVLDPEVLATLDPFDAVQLAEVIRICRTSPTLCAAGRRLFVSSRQRKASANDADRLKKYLARFGLDWGAVALVRGA